MTDPTLSPRALNRALLARQLLLEPYRPRIFSSRNPFSVGAYLVDGVVSGAWSLKDGHVVLDPFEDLSASHRRAVEREREALEAFHVEPVMPVRARPG